MENNTLSTTLNKALANQTEKKYVKPTTYNYADYIVKFSKDNELLTCKITDLVVKPVEYIVGYGPVPESNESIVEPFLKEYFKTDNIKIIEKPILERLCCTSTKLLEAKCELINEESQD